MLFMIYNGGRNPLFIFKQIYKGYPMNATFPYQGALLVPCPGHLSNP
jgi:hypothetical protein